MIFSSTELDEVLDLADVVVTIFAGRIVSVVPRAQASAPRILADMTTSPPTARQPHDGPDGCRDGLLRSRAPGHPTLRRRAGGLDRRVGRGDDLRGRDHHGVPDGEQPQGDSHRGVVRRDHRRRPHGHRPLGNLFSLALGQTAAVSAMVFLYSPDRSHCRDHPDAGARPRDRGRPGFAVGAWGANPIIITIGAAGLMEGTAVWLSHGESIVPPASETSWSASHNRSPACPPPSTSSSPSRSCSPW